MRDHVNADVVKTGRHLVSLHDDGICYIADRAAGDAQDATEVGGNAIDIDVAQHVSTVVGHHERNTELRSRYDSDKPIMRVYQVDSWVRGKPTLQLKRCFEVVQLASPAMQNKHFDLNSCALECVNLGSNE